ncbi:hypothetical protein ACFOU0_10465 [Salinicoccus sesuvii]|uniref:EVE domain-containing protein n=1 Tax=Salinicoccus sesuvii TaxID=868281 RepID=A0ABV7N5W8_9STAP
MYAVNGKFNRTFRDFDVYKRLGIVSVTTTRFKENFLKMNPKDFFALYSSGNGWLGVGRVISSAVCFADFEMHQGGRLIDYDQYPFKEIQRINPHFGREEYVIRVEWVALVDSLEAGKDIQSFESKDPVTQLDDGQARKILQAFNIKT